MLSKNGSKSRWHGAALMKWTFMNIFFNWVRLEVCSFWPDDSLVRLMDFSDTNPKKVAVLQRRTHLLSGICHVIFPVNSAKKHFMAVQAGTSCYVSSRFSLSSKHWHERNHPKLSGSERNCSGRWTWATCRCKKWGLDLSRFHIGWFVDVIPSNIKKCSCWLGWFEICLRMIFWWLEWDVYVEYIFLGGITTRMNQVNMSLMSSCYIRQYINHQHQPSTHHE